MITSFIKYHSLGNDFILLDCVEQSHDSMIDLLQHPQWASTVVSLCNRHFGIGADGVLLLKKDPKEAIEMRIFNSDGSEAEICLNGIRCCAYHLYLKSSSKRIDIRSKTQVTQNEIVLKKPIPQVLTYLSSVIYKQATTVAIPSDLLHGHCLDAGNPHFVIFEKTDPSWLATRGAFIEQHEQFPNKTNVEFVWQEEDDPPLTYRVLVYERGCGMTLACSSGAAAITKALYHLGKIHQGETVQLLMQGGSLETTISAQGEVSLLGTAQRVFSGSLDHA